MSAKKKPHWKIMASFALLFLLYHAAEYMIVSKNNALGFLGCQGIFFLTAFFLGQWIDRTGFKCWGLPFSRRVVHYGLVGIFTGLLLYITPFLISIATGVEKIGRLPGLTQMIKTSLPFVIGVLFSSFSEDILTRDVIYRLFRDKLSKMPLLLISALVYVLNHVNRLMDGPETLLYLFLLGMVLMIPLLYTGNLWLTGFMHWTGNVVFFVTHQAIPVEESSGQLSSNMIFALWMLFYIPLVWLVSRRFYGNFQ